MTNVKKMKKYSNPLLPRMKYNRLTKRIVFDIIAPKKNCKQRNKVRKFIIVEKGQKPPDLFIITILSNKPDLQLPHRREGHPCRTQIAPSPRLFPNPVQLHLKYPRKEK